MGFGFSIAHAAAQYLKARRRPPISTTCTSHAPIRYHANFEKGWKKGPIICLASASRFRSEPTCSCLIRTAVLVVIGSAAWLPGRPAVCAAAAAAAAGATRGHLWPTGQRCRDAQVSPLAYLRSFIVRPAASCTPTRSRALSHCSHRGPTV